MYDHILQNNTIRYCLEAFNTAETLKNHVNDCFKVNGKQMIKMPKKKKMLDSKIMKRN